VFNVGNICEHFAKPCTELDVIYTSRYQSISASRFGSVHMIESQAVSVSSALPQGGPVAQFQNNL
jgi:hypothetical protein